MNLLQQVNFKLTLRNPKYSNLEYFCVAVNLPVVTMGEVKQNYRNQQGYFPGDTIAYDALRLKFMISEDMMNYIEAYNWIRDNSITPGPGVRSDEIGRAHV